MPNASLDGCRLAPHCRGADALDLKTVSQKLLDVAAVLKTVLAVAGALALAYTLAHL